MGSIGDDFDTDVPAVGAAGTDYASDIDDILDEVIARLSTPVPIGSLAAAQTGETLDMNAQGVLNAGYVQLYGLSSAPSGSPYNVIKAYNGELYWVGPAGAVRITADGAINAAGVGGITGDYSSTQAAVSYVDASKTYEFYSDAAAADWAIIKARQWDAVDQVTGRVVHVKPSSSIAATWTLSLPVNDPAAGVSLVTINSSGAMAYADGTAVTNEPLFNTDITLQGTKKIKHGTRSRAHGIHDYVVDAGTWTLTKPSTSGNGVVLKKILDTSGGKLYLPLEGLQVGERILSVSVRFGNTVPTTSSVTTQLYQSTTASFDPIGSAQNNAYASGFHTQTQTLGSPQTVAADATYWIEFTVALNAGTQAIDVYSFSEARDQA